MSSAVRVIVLNPLYTGRVRWNVSQFVRDPDSGSYKRRRRPESDWHEFQDESLRIVSDAQFKQADLNLMTQKEQLKLNVQNYELQNSNALTQLQKAKSNLSSDENNVTLAKEVYDVTTLQYREGTVPLTDLLNAETSYKESQSNYINSMLSYYQAKLGLEQSTGSLSEFYTALP